MLGIVSLNFNFTLKPSAAKAAGIKAGAEKDEIGKVRRVARQFKAEFKLKIGRH